MPTDTVAKESPLHSAYARKIDWIEPMVAVRRLADRPDLTFLDSAMPHESLGRYSYLACDPFGSFSVDESGAWWHPASGDVFFMGEPWQALRTLLSDFRCAHDPTLPPFQGGLAGYFAYDLNRTIERVPIRASEGNHPLALLHAYDVVLAFDHREQQCWIVSTGWPEQNAQRRAERAQQRADQLADRLATPSVLNEALPVVSSLSWQSGFTWNSYVQAVQKVVDLILHGDAFQANIAQRFEAELPDGFDALAFYERLRASNAAPFAAFLRYGDTVIASSSPERFLKVEGSSVETRPIKGTIARSDDLAEDRRRADKLLASAKDRAENIMIVDLLRNDLSRVCTPDSVDVPVLCGLESYASVHHLVSVVTGALAPDEDAVTLLRACFPGGSITGAPKVRAMEIIADIEPVSRDVYCGSIGFIGFDGTMDTNIAIRTATLRDGKAVFHVGGGVIALSDPQAEYDETLAKAQRIFDAFGAGLPK